MFVPKSSINSYIPELAEAKLTPGEAGWTKRLDWSEVIVAQLSIDYSRLFIQVPHGLHAQGVGLSRAGSHEAEIAGWHFPSPSFRAPLNGVKTLNSCLKGPRISF